MARQFPHVGRSQRGPQRRNSQGIIEQLITGLVNGQWYKLTFDTALNPDQIPDQPFHRVWLGHWDYKVVSLWVQLIQTPVGPRLLLIPLGRGQYYRVAVRKHRSGGIINCCYGPALDNVALNAVPLPAALPLFAAGLGAMGYFGSRRRRKAALAA